MFNKRLDVLFTGLCGLEGLLLLEEEISPSRASISLISLDIPLGIAVDVVVVMDSSTVTSLMKSSFPVLPIVAVR